MNAARIVALATAASTPLLTPMPATPLPAPMSATPSLAPMSAPATELLATVSAPAAALTCAVSTPAGRPVTFAPKVGLTPRRVTARANLELTGCSSPDGSAAFLRSGWAVVKAGAHASCTSARQVRGRAVITWFGADGRPVGTSRLRVRADRLVAQRPADTLLTGDVAAGWLVGERVQGGISPATALLGCATRGMSALQGDGRITFG
ncbi:hypothetical protein GCM10009733_089940 [Nonomuraea maheshkhaliensis]|uniref:Ig-like domain-containing protein n=1 Tax=Nonomuraea maheshkhaliensis TaxID=419590 RepID=A0ABP4SY17_9ACTN